MGLRVRVSDAGLTRLIPRHRPPLHNAGRDKARVWTLASRAIHRSNVMRLLALDGKIYGVAVTPMIFGLVAKQPEMTRDTGFPDRKAASIIEWKRGAPESAGSVM